MMLFSYPNPRNKKNSLLVLIYIIQYEYNRGVSHFLTYACQLLTFYRNEPNHKCQGNFQFKDTYVISFLPYEHNWEYYGSITFWP
jgi:hypothetical protein